ncbi:MAG TPA: ACT domain-containing protein [Thermoanaerobaculia bacterium]|nr:ACT domain-containing protein [Thermoanaerobaculia bacterium]
MQLRISLLPGLLAVCRLAPDAEAPPWVRGTFTSVTRTEDELSVVCDDDAVPEDVRAERGWRLLKVLGPIPFEMTGVAAALVAPLAEARISVFLLATFDTDYLLLKEAVLEPALAVLRGAGHHITAQEIN